MNSAATFVIDVVVISIFEVKGMTMNKIDLMQRLAEELFGYESQYSKNLSECDIDSHLVGATVTSVSYHPETGETLTIWLRLTNGKLVAINPSENGYKLLIDSCDWAEEFHGGNK